MLDAFDLGVAAVEAVSKWMFSAGQRGGRAELDLKLCLKLQNTC